MLSILLVFFTQNLIKNLKKVETLLYVFSFICLLGVCTFSLHVKEVFLSYMYLGECPKIEYGRHFHGNQPREKICLNFSPYLIIIDVQ